MDGSNKMKSIAFKRAKPVQSFPSKPMVTDFFFSEEIHDFEKSKKIVSETLISLKAQ